MLGLDEDVFDGFFYLFWEILQQRGCVGSMFGEMLQSGGRWRNHVVSMLAKRHGRRKFPLTLTLHMGWAFGLCLFSRPGILALRTVYWRNDLAFADKTWLRFLCFRSLSEIGQ